jgi:hypothetical protein
MTQTIRDRGMMRRRELRPVDGTQRPNRPSAARRLERHDLFQLFRLERARRRLLVRAVIALAGASAALSFLPFRRAIAFGSVPLRAPRRAPAITDYVWAVEAAARRVPWRALCIEQGLALQHMLRNSGIDAVLHYGARHEPGSDDLQAHVWVTVGTDVVIGGREASGFALVASFP